MPRHLALTSFLVPDYDEAIAWFTEALGFDLREDTLLAPGKRWVVVAPSAAGGTGGALLLAKAGTPEQQALVGRQCGGRVGFFLHTDDFDADLANFARHGVRLKETPRHEAYGRVVVFEDRWGNLWDLIQPASVAA